MTEISNERLAEHLSVGGWDSKMSLTPSETNSALLELLSLRNAQSEAVAVKASCPTCNGTGDHCENPDFGQCDDCGGTGWLHALTHPAPPLAVTNQAFDLAVKALRSIEEQADNAGWNIGKPGHKFTPADIQAGYFNIRDFARASLTAALEAKQ